MHVATPETEYGLYLNIGTIVALVGAVAAGVTKFWAVERAIDDRAAERDEELRTEMEAKFDNLTRDMKTIERDSLARVDTTRHETGEVGAALRQKIHEVEVFSRDTFVSKGSFETVVNRIENSIDKLGDRLETKIDRALGRRD